MKKRKKKICKILLMMPVLLLFNSLHVCAAVEAVAGGEATAAATEAVTEVTTEEEKATPGDAWYSSITGVNDDQPKTIDDVYLLVFWVLVVLVVYVISRAFIFIFKNLG